jgi:hypothetical protein
MCVASSKITITANDFVELRGGGEEFYERATCGRVEAGMLLGRCLPGISRSLIGKCMMVSQ